jgi:hypothetical protein
MRTIRILYLLSILFLSFTAVAQPTGGGPGDPDNPVPITGIEILLVAGGVLGIRKFFNKKEKS